MDISILKQSMPAEGFADVRYEIFDLVSIKGSKSEIHTASQVKKSNGNVRVLSGGAFGSAMFTELEDAASAFEKASRASSLIPGKKTFDNVEVNVDTVKVSPEMDPREVPFEEKKALLQKYIDQFMAYDGIVNLESSYYEQMRTQWILNNRGTEVMQEELICGINFRITSQRDDITQITRLNMGGTESYDELLGYEKAIDEKAKQTLALLDAEPVTGGVYDVVLDSDVAGLFIHEAFGHLSEADNLVGNEALTKTMTLGETFAVDTFNVIDNPNLKGYPGTYTYDHEGTKAKEIYLIKEGKLSGRLHSLESANETGEPLTGHARAKNCGFTPIVRMGNIYIDKGEHTVDEMIASIDSGLYLFGSAGGQTGGDTFTFAVQGGYKIENGKITTMVRDIALTGQLFTTLKQIEMIGSEMDFSKAGGCGKGGQILIQSGKGSVPIKIKNMGIGGK